MSILEKVRAEFDKLGAALVDIVAGAKEDIHSAVKIDEQAATYAANDFLNGLTNRIAATPYDFFIAGAKWMAERAKAAATSVTAIVAAPASEGVASGEAQATPAAAEPTQAQEAPIAQ